MVVGVGGAVKQAMCPTSEVGVRKTVYRPGAKSHGGFPRPGAMPALFGKVTE